MIGSTVHRPLSQIFAESVLLSSSPPSDELDVRLSTVSVSSSDRRIVEGGMHGGGERVYGGSNPIISVTVKLHSSVFAFGMSSSIVIGSIAKT